jgi:hypothetical protein
VASSEVRLREPRWWGGELPTVGGIGGLRSAAPTAVTRPSATRTPIPSCSASNMTGGPSICPASPPLVGEPLDIIRDKTEFTRIRKARLPHRSFRASIGGAFFNRDPENLRAED